MHADRDFRCSCNTGGTHGSHRNWCAEFGRNDGGMHRIDFLRCARRQSGGGEFQPPQTNGCRNERDSDRPPRPRLKRQNEPQIVPERSRPVFFPKPLVPRTPNNLSPCDGFLPKWCRWIGDRKPRCPHHSRPRSLRWGFSMQRLPAPTVFPLTGLIFI